MFHRSSSIPVVDKTIIRESLYMARRSSLVSLRRVVCISRLSPQILVATSQCLQPCLKIFIREFSHIGIHYYHVPQIVQHSSCDKNIMRESLYVYRKKPFFSLLEESGLHFQIVSTNFIHYIPLGAFSLAWRSSSESSATLGSITTMFLRSSSIWVVRCTLLIWRKHFLYCVCKACGHIYDNIWFVFIYLLKPICLSWSQLTVSHTHPCVSWSSFYPNIRVVEKTSYKSLCIWQEDCLGRNVCISKLSWQIWATSCAFFMCHLLILTPCSSLKWSTRCWSCIPLQHAIQL